MISREELTRLHEKTRKDRAARLLAFGKDAGGGGETVALVFLRFHTATERINDLVEMFEMAEIISAARVGDDERWDGSSGTIHLYPAEVRFHEPQTVYNYAVNGEAFELWRPCLHLNGVTQQLHYEQPVGPARCDDCQVSMTFSTTLGHWVPREEA